MEVTFIVRSAMPHSKDCWAICAMPYATCAVLQAALRDLRLDVRTATICACRRHVMRVIKCQEFVTRYYYYYYYNYFF